MAKAEKLLKRIASEPKDLHWEELVTLMRSLGFDLHRGSGSSRKFVQKETRVTLSLHEPHPSGILKQYQIRMVVELLRNEGCLP